MNEITPLLDQYNSLVNVIMNTDYSAQEYDVKEQELATTLKKLHGKLSREHLCNITKVSQVINSEAVMVPMAQAVGSIKSDESFDYVLDQFLDCFEDGRNETATANACYQAMLTIDADRVQRECIDQHPFFM
ncbi:MAG: hypothetical protein ACPG47_09065 [Leucothrix sp.]